MINEPIKAPVLLEEMLEDRKCGDCGKIDCTCDVLKTTGRRYELSE